MFVDLWLLLLLSCPWTVSIRLSKNCLTLRFNSDIPSTGPGQKFIVKTETDFIRCSYITGNNTVELQKASCKESTFFHQTLINTSLHDGNNSVSPNPTSSVDDTSRSVSSKVEEMMQQPRSCSCFSCNTKHRNYVSCRICSEEDDTYWDKATFSIVTVAVIVGAVIVLSVIFRNKILRAWKRNDQSSRCTNNSCTDKIEVIPATPRFQIQPYMHRVFEDEDEREMYTEIIDDDRECHPGAQVHHDVILHHECDVTPPFLKRGCGRGGNDEDDYNRLDRQSNRDRPTDCVSAYEENHRLLRCTTQLPEDQLYGEYEVAKPVPDAHVSCKKVKDKPATANAFPDDTFDAYPTHGSTPSTLHNIDHSSDEHTPHDSALDNKTPQHQTSEEQAFPDHMSYNNLLHNSTPHDRAPHDNHSPGYTLTQCTPEETACNNVFSEKLLGKVDRFLPCLYLENTSTVNGC